MKPHIKKHFYGGYWYCNMPSEHAGDIPGRGDTPARAYKNWQKNNGLTIPHIHTVDYLHGGIPKCDCGYTF